MAEIDARLREEVHLLGELLGDTIRNQLGEAFLAKSQHAAAEKQLRVAIELEPSDLGA